MGWAKTLYIEALHAEAKQERTSTGMAVNPPGLFLKRLQQAKTVHGIDSQNASPNQPVRMGKKMPAIVPNRFSGGSSSSGLGLTTNGNITSARERQNYDIKSDGQCKQ